MTDAERISFLSECLRCGEVEFGYDAKYKMYFAFSWLSGYVLSESSENVIDAMYEEYVYCGKRLMSSKDIKLPDKFISWCKRHGIRHIDN